MGLRDIGIADIIQRNAQQFGERPAFTYVHWPVIDGAKEQEVSHRDYFQRVGRLAAGLAAAGIGVGDRVAIISRNNGEFADLYGAAAWLGAILLPVNWRLNAEEVAYILGDGAPKLLIADAQEQPRIAAMSGSLPFVAGYYGIGGQVAPFKPFTDLTAPDRPSPDIAGNADDGYLIIHTAAVDGKPRGALLSQANLIAASTQMLRYWQLDERDVGLVALPLFHVAGAGLLLGMQLAGGASLMPAKFEPDAAAWMIMGYKVTVFSEFAPMLGNLLDAAVKGGRDLGSLRVVTGLDSPQTIARFEAACPKARFWAGYGQSEVSGFTTLSPFRERPGAAGRATFLSTVAVVDELDQVLPENQVGEIVVRGPLVFKGYWRRDADNTATLRNGWHHTGDMGRFDEAGYLWYAGRSPAKELIKPGGENVYPAEVEKAVREHEAIAEVAVIGVPDAQWGEAIKAVCVCRPGRAVSPAELIDFVAGRVARYKKPKHVVFVAALPKTAQGATDRAKVKQEHGGS
jgi:acyl-CoA synthetase (AMP-forming)/AMP-acid ligase II